MTQLIATNQLTLTNVNDGTNLYIWRKYADTETGSGMSDSPDGKRFVGIAVNKTTQTAGTNPADYQWSPLYDNVVIGGRNLLLNSKINVTNSNHLIHRFKLAEKPVAGETYTLTIKGLLGTGKTDYKPFNSGGSILLGALKDIGNGYYQLTLTWRNTGPTSVPVDTELWVYPIPKSIVVDSTIQWAKLEKGNIATDWSPAWEEYTTEEKFNLSMDEQAQINLGYDSTLGQLASRTNTVEQKITDEALTIAVMQSSTYKNDLASLKQADVDLKNQFGVELNGFKDEYNQKITDVDGKILEMTNYFRYDAVNNWAEIGSTGSDFLMRLSNSMLSFYESGNVVAYLSNQKLFIKEAVIQEAITIGNHKMMKYDDNLTIILWTGGAV